MNTGLFVLGLVFLVGGIFAYGYTITETDTYFFGAFTDSESSRPYAAWAWPLGIAGLVLIIIGAAAPSTARVTTHHTIVDEEPTTTRRRTKTVVAEERED